MNLIVNSFSFTRRKCSNGVLSNSEFERSINIIILQCKIDCFVLESIWSRASGWLFCDWSNLIKTLINGLAPIMPCKYVSTNECSFWRSLNLSYWKLSVINTKNVWNSFLIALSEGHIEEVITFTFQPIHTNDFPLSTFFSITEFFPRMEIDVFLIRCRSKSTSRSTVEPQVSSI